MVTKDLSVPCPYNLLVTKVERQIIKDQSWKDARETAIVAKEINRNVIQKINGKKHSVSQ